MKKMKYVWMIALVVLTLIGIVSWKPYEKPVVVSVKPTSLPITMCGAGLIDWNDTTYQQAQLLPGMGNLRYKISTSSAKAQEFFDQGLKLVYGFNHWEAIQSFREATVQDPECAMAYWGLALAYGPNLNDVNPADREKLAFDAIQKAIARKQNATEVERDLIDAMAARYNGKSYAVRDSLNKAYADAMVVVAKKHPNDPEALTICADAIMNTMPWDYWQKDGSPKPETKQAKEILENTIKKFPQHPGAHHLYIHLVEASHPELALPSAKFLEDAMPGAGHLVHMPSHIYVRTGQYDRSTMLNQRASLVDEEYLANSSNRGMYRWGYYPHNVDFVVYSAYMEGRSELAIQTAMKLAYKGSLITNSNPAFAQYFTVEPLHAYVRFGKWQDILSLPDADDSYIYANLMTNYAKGLASVRKGNVTAAKKYSNKVDSLSKLDTLNQFYFSFNPAAKVVQVAANLLRGELLLKQGKTAEGLAALQKAVDAEDDLRYNEPPDWKIPARQFLGAALYDAGKFAEAEKVFNDDLRKNPLNGWSLKGLVLAQEKLGKKTEAAATGKLLAKAFKSADVDVKCSRF
ncbi:MAG TPA: tetratricopeptide repeat protein [Chryseosolibacter sp.]